MRRLICLLLLFIWTTNVVFSYVVSSQYEYNIDAQEARFSVVMIRDSRYTFYVRRYNEDGAAVAEITRLEKDVTVKKFFNGVCGPPFYVYHVGEYQIEAYSLPSTFSPLMDMFTQTYIYGFEIFYWK